MARVPSDPPGGARRNPRRKGPATAQDVARAVGVSVMTVSRYVNGHTSRLSPATRQRIARAIKALNYRPHVAARGLRLARRWSIGMLIVDTSPTFLADPFITHLVAGLANYLNRHGYALSIQSVAPGEVAGALPLRGIGTDALCILPSGPRRQRVEIGRVLSATAQPVVMFQECLDYLRTDTCRIVQDDFGGAYRLAQHLLRQGARRLVMLVPALEWPAVVERERGVRAALRAGGAHDLAVVRCGDESFEATQSALAAHLADAGLPQAVIGGNDRMALAAVQLMKRNGIAVPDRVMVTGFNAFEFRCYGDPLLTSVCSPAYEMGERGGQELIRRLEEGRFASSTIRLPVRFAPGRTTRCDQGEIAEPIFAPLNEPDAAPRKRRRPS